MLSSCYWAWFDTAFGRGVYANLHNLTAYALLLLALLPLRLVEVLQLVLLQPIQLRLQLLLLKYDLLPLQLQLLALHLPLVVEGGTLSCHLLRS